MSGDLRSKLEPAALSPEFYSPDTALAWGGEIEASKAISLKRIADVLQGDERNSGLIYLLHQIAEAAQR